MRLWLSHSSEVPLREQLVTQIRLGIISGDLPARQKLPSTRELARRFHIHANTVSAAYRELQRSGWVEFRKGSGVYNATKHGVGAFSESLRQEVTGRHLRVSLVEPGAVATELADHVTNPLARAAIDQMRKEMKAPLRAEDIAEAIFYAVSQPQHLSVNEILIRPTEQTR